jgi:hypothetical protein
LLPPGIEAWSSDTILSELSQLLKLRQFQMQVPVLFEEKVAGRERE